MNLDEAIEITIQSLKAGTAAQYGYDLYPTEVLNKFSWANCQRDQATHRRNMANWTPIFFDAGWEICRRGIVRPGVADSGGQAVSDGGYSLTAAGRALLETLDAETILILQPGSLAATLASFQDRYGQAFFQRAQEAIRCRDCEAWLACCVMVGGAAEAILLAVAVSKLSDEDQVLGIYRAAQGRQRLTNAIAGALPAHVRQKLETFTGIIALWRDDAAHGQASLLSNANADEALRQLLHMAQWVSSEWKRLTATS